MATGTEINKQATDIALKEKLLREMHSIAMGHSGAMKDPAVKWTVCSENGRITVKKQVEVERPKSSFADTKDSFPIKKECPVDMSGIVYFFGLKIDLKSKADYFRECFRRNYLLSKSHNLLVSKFAEMKTGFYTAMLSLLGVSADEIDGIKKAARESEIASKKSLFEENEYTSELLAITGSMGRKAKAQEKLTAEMRSQIIRQCELLGLTGYYTNEKVLEIRMEQCQKIHSKFDEQNIMIEYQKAMVINGLSDEKEEDVEAKRSKISMYLSRATRRLAAHSRALGNLKSRIKRDGAGSSGIYH